MSGQGTFTFGKTGEQKAAEVVTNAMFGSICPSCELEIAAYDRIVYSPSYEAFVCVECQNE